MRIVFMGTPDFASASLKKLIDERFDVVGVFTQPDKPKGRGMELCASPVKELALENGLPVFQPVKMRDGTALAQIKALEPDILVVVAYGRILPDDILAVPKYGAINVHGSLLPKYRGAAPIQWAVLNGDKITGVTTMYLASEMDTGDIIYTAETEIGEYETSGELFDRLKDMGAELLVKTLRDIDAGIAPRTPQDHSKATLAPPLSKDTARFAFTEDAAHIHNWVRGMNPWPTAWFEQDGKRIKVSECRLAENPQNAAPGTVLALKPLTVAAQNGAVALLSVTPEGGKPMAGTAWAAGRRLKTGDCL